MVGYNQIQYTPCSNDATSMTAYVLSLQSLHVYEDESKQIRCVDAKMLRCCPYNQRTVLIVCSKYWQVSLGPTLKYFLICYVSEKKSV